MHASKHGQTQTDGRTDNQTSHNLRDTLRAVQLAPGEDATDMRASTHEPTRKHARTHAPGKCAGCKPCLANRARRRREPQMQRGLQEQVQDKPWQASKQGQASKQARRHQEARRDASKARRVGAQSRGANNEWSGAEKASTKHSRSACLPASQPARLSVDEGKRASECACTKASESVPPGRREMELIAAAARPRS